MNTDANPISIARLPDRPVYWRRAIYALYMIWRCRYGGDLKLDMAFASEFGIALEGNDRERDFQIFLARPNARKLIDERSNLPKLLDDSEKLAMMPEGSLGRAYLAMSLKDGVLIQDFIDIAKLPAGRVDELRKWFREREYCQHELLHALTDYIRDEPGESAVLAFTLAFAPPNRLLKVSLLLSLFVAPKMRLLELSRYIYSAWKRGRESQIPIDTLWEELLPLPIAEVRKRLCIRPTQEAHPDGVWRSDSQTGRWEEKQVWAVDGYQV